MTFQEKRVKKGYIYSNILRGYLEQQKGDNITELENKLKRLVDENVHEKALQIIKHYIAYVEALTFEESVHTYVVDSEGVLVEHTLETEVTETIARVPNAEPGQLTTSNDIEISEYNAPDI